MGHMQRIVRVQNRDLFRKLCIEARLTIRTPFSKSINCIKGIEGIIFVTSNFQHLVYWLSYSLLSKVVFIEVKNLNENILFKKIKWYSGTTFFLHIFHNISND